QAPDVAGALGSDLKIRPVGAEFCHASLIELLFLPRGRLYLTVVERALRHPDPMARRAGELVREQMRILHTESAEDDFTPVRASVAIRVTEENDLGPMLDIDAIFVRQHSERDGEPLGEDARFA